MTTLSAAPASAERGGPRVAVLGLLAAPDDRGFARDVAGTVRWAARRERRWRLARVQDDARALVARHGCLRADELCLSRIAGELGVDGLVLGRVTKTRGRRWSVGLVYFDRRQVRVVRSRVDTFPVSGADVDDLRPRAIAWVEALAGGR